MTASIHLLCTPAPQGNAFHAGKLRLIAALARLPVPLLDDAAAPEQIETVADFIRDVARLTDQLIRIAGAELQAAATTPIKLHNFQRPCLDAVEKYAVWDIACIAEELRHDNEIV
jgi:hypothetical protein